MSPVCWQMSGKGGFYSFKKWHLQWSIIPSITTKPEHVTFSCLTLTGICHIAVKLLRHWKRAGVWKEHQFTKTLYNTLESNYFSYYERLLHCFGRILCLCWLSLLSLQSNHFISGVGRGIDSLANHKLCLIRASKWTLTRLYSHCLRLQLGMRKERRRFALGGKKWNWS